LTAGHHTFSLPGFRGFSIQELLLLLIAFSLPLERLLPALFIGLLLIHWIVSGNWHSRLTWFQTNRSLVLPGVLYLLCLAGMLYTEDKGTGWKDLETKLSLLVLPLVLLTREPVERSRMNSILDAFVWGCLISMILCFSHSVYLYYDEIAQVKAGTLHDTYTNTEFFFASRLSWFVHPSYGAMYVTMAMTWIFYSMRPAHISKKNILLLSLNFIFTIFIFFLASKLGMITALLSWLVFLVCFVVKRKWYLQGVIFFFLLSGGIYLLVTRSAIIASRFEYAWKALNAPTDITSSESSAVRLLIWKAGREVISENAVLGVGTGDIHSALDAKYVKYGMSGALEHHLNAHSQYLQTFIVLGLPGILTFVCMLLVPLAKGVRARAWPLVFFILLFAINTIVESMLELEAGVLFFAFFYSLLLSSFIVRPA
jgi:O-antigen ligase